MDKYIFILLFLLMYSVQWLYVIYSCDKKTSSFTNRTAWDDLNICITIETSTGFIYVIDKISAGLIYIYEHLSQTLLIILIFCFLMDLFIEIVTSASPSQVLPLLFVKILRRHHMKYGIA